MFDTFLEAEEDVKTDVFSSEDNLSVDAVSGPSTDETLPINKRSEVVLSHTLLMVHLMSKLKRPPLLYSSEDSQAVPSLCEPQVESLGFLSPDDGV